jgi:hypothetical protein
MNWKRGLTRIYLVLWALFAVVSLFFVWNEWEMVSKDRKTVSDFLRDHPGVQQEWLEKLKTESIPYEPDTLAIEFPPNVLVRESPMTFRTVGWAAQSERFQHSTRVRARAVGWWLLICGLAPATLFLIARWITAGFAKN